MKKFKVALVYDRVNKWGGAERVLLALHELFPKAPLYTSVYREKKAPWAKVFNVKTTFLQKVPFVKERHELFAIFMPKAFEEFRFDSYDVVISVTSESAKGIITKSGTVHICYCLTPTRYLWSGYNEYFKNKVFKALARPFLSYLKEWDLRAAKRPDVLFAISKEVKKRIQLYYKRDSRILYPPLAFSKVKKIILPKEKGYFLVVSRLVPYKRVDLAIKACNRLGLPLKVVGIGVEMERLKKLSGPTIQFLGSLTEERLLGYYKNCKALIFPGKEDFGLVTLEAQSFGKPVIAFADGGALETIIKEKTGLFFPRQNEKSLILALKSFNKKKFRESDCKKNALKFSKDKFKKEFRRAIKEVLKDKKR